MYNNYFSNFGRPLIPDDLCKAFSLLEKILKIFTIYGPPWSTDRNHFSNPSFPQSMEAPYETWAKLAQRLQRRSRLKMLTDGRTDARTDENWSQ